jgi:hypothetical protein
MFVTNYTPEDLNKLPLRAIVALIARCARKLLRLDLGSYPQAGNQIDPSSKGQLGPLGPEEAAP